MNAAKLKGSLLEYVIRRILMNCGFTRVKADGLLIFERGGLTMINGKGAAHDADVLMNPPIQMPFSYPSRINFECKSYNRKIGLTIIRNALGLRYDLNEFEIISRRTLQNRQNNRRSKLALDNRQRYNYQIGVATVNEFTKPAFEFAANNKIPLISLRWFLPNNICDKFHLITAEYINRFSQSDLENLHLFLKDDLNESGKKFILKTDSAFRDIYRAIQEFENHVIIGLLESGDMLFLVSENSAGVHYIRERNDVMNAQFHYSIRDLDYWTLSINQHAKFGFYLPKNIIQSWKEQNFSRRTAIDIKQEMFSKVIVFIKNQNVPFRILRIDREWLDQIEE